MSGSKKDPTPEELYDIAVEIAQTATEAHKLIYKKAAEVFPNDKNQKYLFASRVVNALFGRHFVVAHYEACKLTNMEIK